MTRFAYLCSDPGIPPDGTKGASVHFRAMRQALENAGAEVDAFMARGYSSDRYEVVAPVRGRGAAGELALLAANAPMLAALTARGPHDAVYERLALFGVAGLAYARQSGIPLVLEVNSPLWIEAERFRSLELRHVARSVALDVIRDADAVLAVSETLAAALIEAGADTRRTHVVPNGVDRDLFERARPATVPSALRGRPVLVFIGSLKPWHGVPFLLEAFMACRHELGAALWVVGDGPMASEVERAAALHPGDVVFDHGVRHDDVPGILRAADVALAPYPADAPDYFSPLKVIEALASGCPLVASRTRCVVDSVRGHDRVRLHEPGDVGGFVSAVSSALDMDRSMPRSVPRGLGWADKARDVLALVEAS